MDAWLYLAGTASGAVFGLALISGRVRWGEDLLGAAVELTKDRDDRQVRRLRKMHQRAPTVRRLIGWAMFWWALPSFAHGLLQLFGVAP